MGTNRSQTARRTRLTGKRRKSEARMGRESLHRHAAQLMTDRGFAGMSARKLAESLDVSKANLFYHLETKEALLYDIFVELLEHCGKHIEDILARPDPPPAKLRRLIHFYVELLTERSAVMLVWFNERGHLTTRHQKHVTQLETRFMAPLLDFYRRGVKDGHFRQMDPWLARMTVFGTCFLLAKEPRPSDTLSPETISEQLQEFVCEGLLQKR